MKYGLNQCGFPSESFSETCAIVAEAGYDGIEPNYTLDGPLSQPAKREEMLTVASEFGLDIPSVSTTLHWEYPLSSLDKDRRERGLEIGEKMIDAATKFDADEILIVPAVIDEQTSYNEGYRNAVDSVKHLLDYADNRNVNVAIENVQNNFLPSPVEFRTFLEEIANAGSVVAYFDIGNAFRSGLPSRWIRVLDDWIAKIHVKDWLQDSHRQTYPLQGNIDWESVIDAIADIEYDGWITAEVPAYPSFGYRMPPQILTNLEFLFEEKL